MDENSEPRTFWGLSGRTRITEIELCAGLGAAALVRRAPAGSYGLTDLFDEESWMLLLAEGSGVHILNGTISGAAGALVARGVDMPRLGLPGPETSAIVANEDLVLAREWLVSATAPRGSTERFQDAGITVAARGWMHDSLRITSLILAVLSVAVCAAREARPPADRRRTRVSS